MDRKASSSDTVGESARYASWRIAKSDEERVLSGEMPELAELFVSGPKEEFIDSVTTLNGVSGFVLNVRRGRSAAQPFEYDLVPLDGVLNMRQQQCVIDDVQFCIHLERQPFGSRFDTIDLRITTPHQ